MVTENTRVQEVAGAMSAGGWYEVGALMGDSHRSMRDDFEISSPELDAIVQIATDHPGCFGARMTGGGFAGCAVALVKAGAVADFVEVVRAEYRSATQHEASAYVTMAGAGAEVVEAN